MMDREDHYLKIADAINFIKENFKKQPSLTTIAAAVGLSPSYFQRMFYDWAGVSPKKFMQFLSVEYAKDLLKNEGLNVLDAAYETGFSGSSRLHDLFVNIEKMTPGEYRNNGENLKINYSFELSSLGKILLASTARGVCHLAFYVNAETALDDLKLNFSSAEFIEERDEFQMAALRFFQFDWTSEHRLKKLVQLHLKGSDFQLKVWQALLMIPIGNLVSYGSVSVAINSPKASRAVGNAIGSNPVAFLIPCHRVIQANGQIGGYRWGEKQKSAIIAWEGAKLHK